MLHRSNGIPPLQTAGNGSVSILDPKEPTSGPIILYGGTINDVKAAVPADDNKLISLEARLCGKFTFHHSN